MSFRINVIVRQVCGDGESARFEKPAQTEDMAKANWVRKKVLIMEGNIRKTIAYTWIGMIRASKLKSKL